MTSQAMAEMIKNALSDLYSAEMELWQPTTPQTPMPRNRRYVWIRPDVIWPYSEKVIGVFHFSNNAHNAKAWSYTDTKTRETSAFELLDLCGRQPNKVLKLIFMIMAATKWCLDRAEGRKRNAREILRQQAESVRQLEEISALKALSTLGKQ